MTTTEKLNLDGQPMSYAFYEREYQRDCENRTRRRKREEQLERKALLVERGLTGNRP